MEGLGVLFVKNMQPAGIFTTPVFLIGLIVDLTTLQIKLLMSITKAWLRFITLNLLIL
jgi:hypothetical protein